MTTPGGNLQVGGGHDYGQTLPEDAYRTGGTGRSALTDLNTLTEESAKERMKAPMAGPYGRFQGNFFTYVMQGFVNVVVAATNVVIDVVEGVFSAIEGLFGDAAADTAAMEQARVSGENAVVEHMGRAVDKLDQIVRCGGAYSNWEHWRIAQGDNTAHIFPLTTPFPASAGVAFIPPADPLTPPPAGHVYSRNDANYKALATSTGAVELLEPGLWLVFFQTAARSWAGWGGDGAGAIESWCYVTPAGNDWTPIGRPFAAPTDPQENTTGYPAGTPVIWTLNRINRADIMTAQTVSNYLVAYGRTTTYGGSDTPIGGYTAFGMVPVILEAPGYKITLSTQMDWHYGGAASTYVWAFKVNSAALVTQIAELKSGFAAAMPGVPVDRLMTSAKVAELQTLVGQKMTRPVNE